MKSSLLAIRPLIMSPYIHIGVFFIHIIYNLYGVQLKANKYRLLFWLPKILLKMPDAISSRDNAKTSSKYANRLKQATPLASPSYLPQFFV